MLYLCILLGFVFFAGVAMTVNEGLWNNAVNLITVCLSGVVAYVYGIPLGKWLLAQTGKDESFTWFFLFGGVWVLFGVTQVVLSLLATRASKVRMRFIPQLDKALGMVTGLLTAVFFTSLLALTLLKMPVGAEAWKLDDAAEWQKTWMVNAATPFNSILKAVGRGENVDLDI